MTSPLAIDQYEADLARKERLSRELSSRELRKQRTKIVNGDIIKLDKTINFPTAEYLYVGQNPVACQVDSNKILVAMANNQRHYENILKQMHTEKLQITKVLNDEFKESKSKFPHVTASLIACRIKNATSQKPRDNHYPEVSKPLSSTTYQESRRYLQSSLLPERMVNSYNNKVDDLNNNRLTNGSLMEVNSTFDPLLDINNKDLIHTKNVRLLTSYKSTTSPTKNKKFNVVNNKSETYPQINVRNCVPHQTPSLPPRLSSDDILHDRRKLHRNPVVTS